MKAGEGASAGLVATDRAGRGRRGGLLRAGGGASDHVGGGVSDSFGEGRGGASDRSGEGSGRG